MSEIKWVATRPDGTVCGPIYDDEDTVWKMLQEGYARTQQKYINREGLRRFGYNVRLAEITLLERKEGG